MVIDIDGVPNQLYSKGMSPTDFWDSICKRFPNDERGVNMREFYTVSKFGLWIDLRTFADNNTHGEGFKLRGTQDGIRIQIKRKSGGSGKKTCHMFVVADAMMEVMEQGLKSILY